MKNDRLLLLAFFLSGTAALGYEVLWTRLLALALGSESLGILSVLAGFFGGLALGSWLLHERARQSRDPAGLFARLELIAAAYAAVSPFLLYALARNLPVWLGPTAGDNNTLAALALALTIATLALLPATFCMGATLAALVEARRRALPGDAEGHGLGRLYAANTAGATVGVLATVYVLLPAVGMIVGAVVLAVLGVAAAALAIRWRRNNAPNSEAVFRRDEDPAPRWVYPLLATTGFAAVGLEVVGVHVLAQVLEDTVYTFAGALAMYLIGNAVGAALYAASMPVIRERPVKEVTLILVFLQTVSIAFVAMTLSLVPKLLHVMAPPDASHVRHMLAELALAALVFLTPTLVMGALFSHVTAQIAGRGVGKAYALNTLGGTLAPFLFGLIALRELGYAPTLYLAAAIYAVVLLLMVLTRWTTYARGFAALGTAAFFLLIAPKSLILLEIPQGWKPIDVRPGLYGLVMVTEQTESIAPGQPPFRRLQINRHFRMGGSLSFGEQRMGHLPLLLKPDARSVLFLGVGTGATLSAVRHHDLERIEAVEIVPEALELLPAFETINEGVANDPKIRFHAADARRYVAASRDRYDLIVGDLFHPARDGAGSLYSLEHFETLAEKLEPGGLLVQWIPLYQFDEPTLKIVLRTFLEVFPEVHSMLGIYNVETPALALIGSQGELKIDLERFNRQLQNSAYRRLLMQDARDNLGAYMLDRAALAEFAGDAPLNTDLSPTVLFLAPKSAYGERQELKWQNLETLLPHRQVYPEGLMMADDGTRRRFRDEVAAFSRALTSYLEAEVLRAETFGGPMPDAAIEHYLTAYETAPEFAPAQTMLWIIARRERDWTEKIIDRMLARAPENMRTHAERLDYLRFLGDRVRFDLALAEAQERFGKERFPDLAEGG